MVPSAFSLSLFSHLAYKCPHVALRNSAIPYNTLRLRFPSHLLAASDSRPICVHLLQQVHGSCSYVLCPHRQFHSFACSQFSSLILRPGTSACFLVKVMGKGIPSGYTGRGTTGTDKDKVLHTLRHTHTLTRDTHTHQHGFAYV